MQTQEKPAGLLTAQNEIKHLLNDIRVECQQSDRWEQIKPLFNKLDGVVTNFFTNFNG